MSKKNNDKLKLLHTIVYLNTGGTEALLKEYLTKINADRFVSSVMVSREHRNTAVEQALSDAGIRTCFIGDKIRSRPKIHGYFLYNALKTHFLCYRYISSVKPDIIHTHLATNRYVVLYSLFHPRVKLFHTVHCPPEQMFEGSPTALKENKAVKFLTKHRGMKLIGLHPEMAAELDRRFELSGSEVLNNGIDMEKYVHPGVTKAEMRSELGIPGDAFVLGHVGRMAPEKNHEFILKVFGELLKRREDARLLLVGSGLIEREVEAMIETSGFADKITHISNRADVNRVLRAMDCFIFPSTFEGMGIALLEAEAAGLRCVVSENVPLATHLSDKLMSLSLDAPLSVWCDAITDGTMHSEVVGSLGEFDINTVIGKLEKMYEGSLSV